MADFTRFPEAFQKAGIRYSEEPGWRNRGHGDITSFNFIVVHHTAGGNDAGDIRIVRDGRSDLPGPLSQIVLKRDGTPHIIACGVCYHAPGDGKPRWGAGAMAGNWYSIGIEGVSNGYNDWTQAQRDAYPKVVAAILKEAGLPSDRWVFHREYSKDGKIDAAGFTREWFAAKVNEAYNSIGRPSVPPKSEIQKCREINTWLGDKTTAGDELILPVGQHGRATFYTNGAIYYSELTGAQALSNEMVAKYAEVGYEGSFLGFPINTVHEIAGGRAQAFQGASIYFSEATGAHTIGGQIGSKWASNNWESGYYGFPETDEIVLPDKVGKLQKFQGCHVYHSPNTGTFAIQGIIWDRFTKESYERGIGYPISDETSMPIKAGKFQIFEQGHIYWKEGSEKAFAVYYDFMDLYSRLGYESGRLGLVISAKELVEGTSNTWIQHFEGGSIQINRDTKETVLIINGNEIKV